MNIRQKILCSGFSLLELMIAVSIIGVLASIALPNYLRYTQKAYAASCLSNRTNMEIDTNIDKETNTDFAFDKITSYQCPMHGVYTWHSTDSESPFFGKVLCSIHLNSENTSVKFDVPSGEDITSNSSFENLERTPRKRGWMPINSSQVDGWESDSNMEIWSSGMLGIEAPEGDYYIELDSHKKSDSIYQQVETEKGRVYEVRLKARARKNGTSDFQVSFGDGEPEEISPEHGVWNDYTIKVVGTGDPMKLSIAEVPGQNDGLGALLDSIQVVATDEVSQGS
jgi:prepilin-type N-terminal cleavage/methylation domain-containing protein